MKKEEVTFDQIFDKYYNRILKYCNFRINNYHASEDITSEVFFLLLQKWNNFDLHPETGVLAWLYKSAAVLVKQYYKKENQIPVPLDEVSPRLFSDETVGLDEEQKYKEYIENIKKELPEKDLILFEYVVVEKLKYKNIAEKMQISENAVKLRWYRLRDELEKYIISYIN